MSFSRLYRASMYAMLFLATLLLSIDAGRDSRYAMLYPVAVALAGAVAFLTVDRDSGVGMPRDLANFLGLGATLLAFAEYYSNTDLLVLALGHWLIYLLFILFFLKKTVEDEWYLFGMGLVLVVIGVFMSQSDEVGSILIAWALTTLWTFGLFHLRREAARPPASRDAQVEPGPDPNEPYPGLLHWGFVLSSARVAGTTLALGVAIFLLMPRFPLRGGARTGQAPGGHLSGFTSSVKLGMLGEILENDSVVMSVEMLDENGAILEPPGEPLWRGLTLGSYSGGVWSRDQPNSMAFNPRNAPRPRGTHQVTQHVTMESTATDALFALSPILSFRALTGDVVLNMFDGTIYRRDLRPDSGDMPAGRPGPFGYSVTSDLLEGEGRDIHTHLGELNLDRTRLDDLKMLPEDLEGPLAEIIRPILEALPPDKRRSRIEEARALERYLHDGTFNYSLRMTVIDPSIDPVLDFLKNRKEGHCEYFASALALMCRSAKMPSRIVNGFKGGDWNSLSRTLIVRQKHAHSWVEVYLGTDDALRPRWLVLDPTPGRQREEAVAKVGSGLGKQFRPLGDFLREQWIRRIAGLDSDRQEKEIYAPIRNLFQEAWRGFKILGGMLRGALSWFYFDDPRNFFSVRGFFVSVLTMLALAGLGHLALRLVHRLTGRGRGRDGGLRANDPGLASYHRLLRALAAVGLERPEAETPREFARRAAIVLADRPLGGGEVAEVPSRVVEAFYSQRFGLRELTAEVVGDLEARLDALEAALSAKAAA